MATFNEALHTMLNGGFAQRRVVTNDTFIISHKKRLYHFSHDTGVRYSYSPSNKDIHTDDWLCVLIIRLEHKDSEYMSNLCGILKADDEYEQSEQTYFQILEEVFRTDPYDGFEPFFLSLDSHEFNHIKELVLAIEESGNKEMHQLFKSEYERLLR